MIKLQVITGNAETAFISDDLHSYKGSKDEQFFAQVLKLMDLSPKEIVHIGDSSHDIIGAKRAGIPCVWLNRENRVWSQEYNPDVTIHSLSELKEVITTME